jgi:hypothetical protein
MKTRYKILIAIGAALLYFYGVQQYGAPSVAVAYSETDLRAVYVEFNDEYFHNTLPKDTVIDYAGHDDRYVATTRQIEDGRFHIALNKNYAGSMEAARLTILHEDCHIKTWNQEFDEHGKRWRACMLALDAAGAFREQIIDGYREH